MLALIIFSVIFTEAWGLKYTDCGSKNGDILDVQVTGCEDKDICEFRKGETYTYAVKFVSNTDSKDLRAVLHGVLGGVSLPFPLSKPSACEHSDIQCPIESGTTYDYKYDIEVRNQYPNVRAEVKWELRDDKNENIVCVLLPIQIMQ